MAQTWLIDPKSGDYQLSGGRPVQTDSLEVAAYIRLKTPRTKWLYAPDTKYGSDFYLVKKRNTTNDSSALETVAATALQPIADDGRAVEITINTTQVARHGLALDVQLVRNNDKIDNLVLTGLGV